MDLDWNSGEVVIVFSQLYAKLLVWSLTNNLEPISCGNHHLIPEQLEYLGLFSSPYHVEVGQPWAAAGYQQTVPGLGSV